MGSHKRQTPQRRFRIHLRTMFVLVALLGILAPLFFGYFAWRYGRKYKEIFDVTGIVTLNGKPLGHTEVSFYCDSYGVQTTTWKQSPAKNWMKLPPDRYKVTLSRWENPRAMPPDLPHRAVVGPIPGTEEKIAEWRDYVKRRGKQLVPLEYTLPRETPLTFEVTRYGRNHFDFHLRNDDHLRDESGDGK